MEKFDLFIVCIIFIQKNSGIGQRAWELGPVPCCTNFIKSDSARRDG
jgi:hypothetical protein